MLLPQFTIRTLLAITAVAALIAWIIQQSAAGAAWAQAASVMVAFAVILFARYALFFLTTWVAGRVLEGIWPSPIVMATPFGVGAAPAAHSIDANQVQGENPFSLEGTSTDTASARAESSQAESV